MGTVRMPLYPSRPFHLPQTCPDRTVGGGVRLLQSSCRTLRTSTGCPLRPPHPLVQQVTGFPPRQTCPLPVTRHQKPWDPECVWARIEKTSVQVGKFQKNRLSHGQHDAVEGEPRRAPRKAAATRCPVERVRVSAQLPSGSSASLTPRRQTLQLLSERVLTRPRSEAGGPILVSICLLND